MIIPQYKQRVRFILATLEEREREEFARLKKVKAYGEKDSKMAKDEIKRLLENSKKTLESEYETSSKSIKDKLQSAKKKTLDKI